jgi:hypothetical protein
MFHDGVSGCTLVVCPMSLLSQWRDEIAKFSSLEVLLYYGNSKDRRQVDFSRYDVVLTSYGVVAAEHRAVVQAQHTANAAALAAGQMGPATLSARQLANLSPIMATNFFRIRQPNQHTTTGEATLRATRRGGWCLFRVCCFLFLRVVSAG